MIAGTVGSPDDLGPFIVINVRTNGVALIWFGHMEDASRYAAELNAARANTVPGDLWAVLVEECSS